MITKLGLVALVLFAAHTRSIAGDADADRVKSIPNYRGPLCWKQWAGYLKASHVEGRGHRTQLFYWYHEATENPEEKPLVLWLNGGPGCSSLGGMFTELGPFVLNAKLGVSLNPFSFNRAANIIFLEQPAGVGYSYPNLPANDTTTAIDTDLALRHFLRDHPELEGRDFYVMGESYGGHYVPNTVKQIQMSNAALPGGSNAKINIKGFAVGNGYTDWRLDFNANVENGRYHALTSEARFQAAKTACAGDYARCFWPRPDVDCPDDCAAAVHAATEDAMDGSIDIYDIYEDVCIDPGQERLETQASVLLMERRKALATYFAGRKVGVPRELRTIISPVFPTCIDRSVAAYLNRPDVQKTIHVRPGTVPNGKWAGCGNVDYDFNYESELPNYVEWTRAGDLEILIYNGDADYILSHMGNSAWINEGLNLTKNDDWTKWRGSDGQVAGFFETYKTGGIPMTFLTVKGAGHMVPKDRPRHALDFFRQFLAGGRAYDKVERGTVTPLCTEP